MISRGIVIQVERHVWGFVAAFPSRGLSSRTIVVALDETSKSPP